MPKAPQSKLHELVRSLSASEKRHFRKNAKTFHSDPIYLRLFDALCAQDQYDEPALKAEFSVPYFSALKNYLYEALIDDLIVLEYEGNEEQRLYRCKQKAWVLVRKGFPEAAFALLKKSIEQALAGEFFAQALDLVQTQAKLYANWKPFSLEDFKDLQQKIDFCLSRLHNQQRYQRINLEFVYWQRKERHLPGQALEAAFDAILQDPSMREEALATTSLSKMFFLSTYEGYHKIKGNYEQALFYSQRLTELFEARPHFCKQFPSNYLSILINRLNALYYTRKLDELREGLERLGEVSFDDSKLEIIRFSRYAVLYLNYMKLSNNYSFFDSLKIKIKEFESKNNLPPTEIRLLYYNIAELEIWLGHYRQALDALLVLHDLPATDTQSDLQRFVRLLEILVHAELGNDFLVDSLCRNALRGISSQSALYEYEKRWVDFFRQLAALPFSERKKYCNKALLEFKAFLNASPERKRLSDYFDFEAWLEQKTENGTR